MPELTAIDVSSVNDTDAPAVPGPVALRSSGSDVSQSDVIVLAGEVIAFMNDLSAWIEDREGELLRSGQD